MGASKYISEIQFINNNQEIIFNYLSNFENLSKYVNEGILEKLTEQVPQIKITDFESDRDSCRFNISGLGQAGISIIEREPFKTIKIVSSGSMPIEIILWIQLLPVAAYETKMRLTLQAEMSMMVKMMIEGKLEKGVNQLAETLAKLPYR
jgi:hypothetical protein